MAEVIRYYAKRDWPTYEREPDHVLEQQQRELSVRYGLPAPLLEPAMDHTLDATAYACDAVVRTAHGDIRVLSRSWAGDRFWIIDDGRPR